jgi:tetratricopeptide (TPR) repeat protein
MPGLQVESYTYPQVERRFYLSILTNLVLAIAVHAAFVLNILLLSRDQAALSFLFLAQIVGGVALIALLVALYYPLGRYLLETCRTKQTFLATPPLIDHALDVLLKTKFDEEAILREAITQFDPVTMTEDEPEVAAKPFPKLWLGLGGIYAATLIVMFGFAFMSINHTPRQMLIRTGIIHSDTVPSDFVPWDSGRYERRGIRAEQKGDLHKAIEEFSFAIRLNPKFIWAYSRRANCWLRLSDAEQKEVNIENAIADMTEVIRLTGSKEFHYYHVRAGMYERLGEPEKALADLTEVIRLTESKAWSSHYYNKRAEMYERLGEPEKAAADREMAK